MNTNIEPRKYTSTITAETVSFVEKRLVNRTHENPAAKNGGSEKITELLLNPFSSLAYDRSIYPVDF
jgi:hypothetical protein